MAAISCEYRDVVLKVENVSLTLGGTPILKDLNVEVQDLYRPGLTQGQVVALLGPSGIGKTSLFRILAGLDAPDSGAVLLDKEAKPVQRGMVGVVAQNYPLFAHRTVLGNLAVAGRQAGMSSSEAVKQADALLQKFGMIEHRSKYPIQLSGGQRQRVAIAQQFMCSEHLLLMDEPFTGLDLLAVESLCEFIKDAARHDELKTFVIVSHDIIAALDIADTIWLLGRDRDAKGNVIPGSRIQATYNLVERGIAWQDKNTSSPEYLQVLKEIREFFPKL